MEGLEAIILHSFCWEIIILHVGSSDKIKAVLNSLWDKVPLIEESDWLSVVLYFLHVWLFISSLCFMTVPLSRSSSSYIFSSQAAKENFQENTRARKY